MLLLIPLIDSFWDKGGDDGYGGGGGKGKGGGGKGSGTACTVKGSYCQVHRIFNFHFSFARMKITYLSCASATTASVSLATLTVDTVMATEGMIGFTVCLLVFLFFLQ